jgi:hypothetical protein
VCVRPWRCLVLFPWGVPRARSALQISIHGTNLTATAAGDVADGVWHYICVSWRPTQSQVRVSLDGRASCAVGDIGVSQREQDNALVQYVRLACGGL